MDSKYLTLIILLSSPLILMVVHIILLKLINAFKLSISKQLSIIVCELMLNLPILLIIYLINKSTYSVIYSFVVYNSLGYSYFHFFNLSETARRIRVLIELKKESFISYDFLMNVYIGDQMIKTRLKRLIGLKQIIKVNDKYFLSSRILYLSAVIISVLRKILGFKEDTQINHIKE